MSNPLEDDSRWTVIGSHHDTPEFLIDEMRRLMRDAFGDELIDALEATIPPPYGTLKI